MNSLNMYGAQGWLNALSNTSVDDDALAAQLATWQADGTVLQAHVETQLDPSIESSASRWTAKHFHLQVDAAKRNFSLERAGHLLNVRKRLRHLGVEGFVPTLTPNERRASATVAQVAAAFEPSSSLSEAITSGDIGLIRAALGLEISDTYLTGSYLQGAMGWAATQCEGLFIPYEEGYFKGAMDSDRSTWTAEYHDLQLVYLKANFSIERFLHVVEIREHLRAIGAAGFTPPVQTPEAGQRAASAPATATQRHSSERAKSTESPSNQHGRTPQQQPESSSDSWPTRISFILAAGLAALAVYFLGGRR